jgi:hypothetical protein
MLFLLSDEAGHALLIAESGSKAEADSFGRNHLPEFCGESIEIDPGSYTHAAEFWGVRTVRLLQMLLDPRRTGEGRLPSGKISFVFAKGLELPEEVVADDFLTPEDHRDLTLDHIARTSDFIGQIRIVKRA